MIKISTPSLLSLALALAFAAGPGQALAQRGGGGFSFGSYPQQTGEELYKGVCQGCHMPDAKGAKGGSSAGYPALAGNKKLGSKLYPVLVVMRGQKAMPDFSSFSDAQIANVVNYVRSNFGNSYTDPVTAEDVKKMRPSQGATGPGVRPGA